VGLVNDQTLFSKMTPGARRLLEGMVETGPPYPGAKNAYIMTERECQDAVLMVRVITACRDDVAPVPKETPKKARKKPRKEVTKKR
jgi:hypothetical protein